MLHINIAISQDYWEILNTPHGLNLSSIVVNPNGVIYIGLSYNSGGGVLKSSDDGLTWANAGLSNLGIMSITTPSNDTIYAGSDYVYRSINDGDSWEIISPLLDPITLFVRDNTNLYVGIWGGIFKSESIGSNWEQVLQLDHTEVVNSIVEDIINGILYAGTINFIGGGGVYRSVNGGNTWEHIGLIDNYVSSLALNSSGDLFAGTRGNQDTGNGGVFVLPTGQSEWINVNNEELVTSMIINSEDKIYIGCSTLDWYWGGVRCSLDNGQTWEDISTESMHDKDIERLILGPEEHLYALAFNSTTPLYKSINSTITSMHDHPVQKGLITYNFPNPFKDETTIYFSFPSNISFDAKITVYNSVGRQIEKMNFPKHLKNEQSIMFNSTNLPGGIYYYELSVGGIRTFRKMVLQK